MPETAPTTPGPVSTMAAFKKIVAALKAVKPQKRPALLDLAMREASDGEDCSCGPAAAPPPPPEQGSLL